ncbi:hypothetical protein HYV72_02270, partial [Candidatus Uhrbacteria bacterium]|nr:hypothetical protein [Candidatus Uhrbacteria bacterium]
MAQKTKKKKTSVARVRAQNHVRRTKIVCTIGPATASVDVQREMIRAGMNVARLNFSHGTHEQHTALLTSLRRVSRELDTPVAIMQDLQGPKIRVGEVPLEGLPLREGDTVHFSARVKRYEHQERLIPVTYGGFSRDVRAGDRILLDDGIMMCQVNGVHNNTVAA